MSKPEIPMDEKFWNPIRHGFPFTENVYYDVKDCRYNIYGKAYYNGFDWEKEEWITPLKGSLMLVNYLVTHWSDSDE